MEVVTQCDQCNGTQTFTLPDEFSGIPRECMNLVCEGCKRRLVDVQTPRPRPGRIDWTKIRSLRDLVESA